VLGGGRALVLEVDGPHHRAVRRVADDHNRDLQWRRCGVPVVRLTVEDVNDPQLLDRRLVEEIKRTLFS
jgi:very-short-patch-repair endonuclease